MPSGGTIAWVVASVTAASATPAAVMVSVMDPDPAHTAMLDFIRDVGIPTGLVLAGIFALWRVGKFFGPIVRDWFVAQTAQAKVVTDAIPRMERAMDAIAEQSREVPLRLDRIETHGANQAVALERLLTEVRSQGRSQQAGG